MYRTAAEPEPITEVIALKPRRARRIILGACLWFMAFWLLVYGPVWIIDALLTGEGWLLVVPAFGLLIAAVWIIARASRMETILLGNASIRRVGFLRTRGMKWRDITGWRRVKRQRARGGGYVELLLIEGRDGSELLVAPAQVEDGEMVFWALGRVEEERIDEIDARVRRDGRRYGPGTYAAHAMLGATIFLLTALLLSTSRADRWVEKELRGLDDLPPAERLEAARELADNAFISERIRCRARAKVVYAHTTLGHYNPAMQECEEMRFDGCRSVPFDDCEGVEGAAVSHQLP